mmetsp:Transcript_4469/g.10201  ORF Transcript_4469/g.10201 Transcript_4469/m.10201 type:complete len:126 (+) Transcript_4469:2857-3234(+)
MVPQFYQRQIFPTSRTCHAHRNAVSERIDDFFFEYPAKKRAFKAHVQSVLKQQRGDAPSTVVQDGTFGGNAYDFYCYFENDIFRNASDEAPGPKRDVNEREEEALAESHAKVLAEKQDRLAFFGF